MKLSHSKLSTILSDPVSYYLGYIEGISLKDTKPALFIGSAVHWGIEHNTENLDDFFKENGSFKQQDAYTKEQLLSEAMVHGYLKHKDELFEEILKDPVTGEKLELLDETHELYVTGKVPTKRMTEIQYHDFVGIIDLLLLTNKGWIVIDYKTSTYEPDWNNYLDQIYRYIMLLRSEFPDVPVCKVGIINIRKTAIRQKKTENSDDFLNRIKFEYELNDEHYVNYHEFPMKDIDSNLLDKYIENLSLMCDMAYVIDRDKLFFINYGAQVGQYGKGQFYDIVYHTPNAYILYKIADTVWDEDEEVFKDSRDCIQLDMEVLDYSNILNKYSVFEEEVLSFLQNPTSDPNKVFDYLKSKYRTDDNLLKTYWKTFEKKVFSESK